MTDRSKLDAYIAELEAAAYRRGVADTWAKIGATVQDFVSEIKSLEAGDAVFPWSDNAQTAPLSNEERILEPREGSDQARVLLTIREGNGMRGVDIVNKLAGEVEERTVRTALFRLKKRGAIIQKEGKWYPVILLFKNIEGQTPQGA